MMTAVILQPGYLPWLGFFDQMAQSDIFVLYDDAQYTKQSWRNRNRIKTAQGAQWLTVPVLTKGKPRQKVKEVQINASLPWRRKHLQALRQAYQKAPYFPLVFPEIEAVLRREWKFLLDLDLILIEKLMQLLRLKRTLLFASSLSVSAEGKTGKLVEICKTIGADTFLEGEMGKAYLKEECFQSAGIALKFHHYIHPVYPQLWGAFIPYLSVVDILFQTGEKSLPILTGEERFSAESR